MPAVGRGQTAAQLSVDRRARTADLKRLEQAIDIRRPPATPARGPLDGSPRTRRTHLLLGGRRAALPRVGGAGLSLLYKGTGARTKRRLRRSHARVGAPRGLTERCSRSGMTFGLRRSHDGRSRSEFGFLSPRSTSGRWHSRLAAATRRFPRASGRIRFPASRTGGVRRRAAACLPSPRQDRCCCHSCDRRGGRRAARAGALVGASTPLIRVSGLVHAAV